MVNFSPFLLVQKLAEEGERKSRLRRSVNMDTIKNFIARFKKKWGVKRRAANGQF